jgi:hypothetical protein
LWNRSREALEVLPIVDSVPSRSVPEVTRALILINVIVFFIELSLPREMLEQVFYLFGLVPARFLHPHWAMWVGFPVNDYWPFFFELPAMLYLCVGGYGRAAALPIVCPTAPHTAVAA